MGKIKDLGEQAFRDFVTDGVPSSGVNYPRKSEVRSVFHEIDASIESLEVSGDTVTKATWAQLSAVTGARDGQRGFVEADTGTHTDPVVGGTVQNQGIYTWSTAPAGWRWLRKDDVREFLTTDEARTLLEMKVAEDEYLDQLGHFIGEGVGDVAPVQVTENGTLIFGLTPSGLAINVEGDLRSYLASLGRYLGDGDEPDIAPSTVTEDGFAIIVDDIPSSAETGRAAIVPYLVGSIVHAVGPTSLPLADASPFTVLGVNSFNKQSVRAVINRPMLDGYQAVSIGPALQGKMVPDNPDVTHVVIGTGQSLIVGGSSGGTLVTTEPIYPSYVLMPDIGPDSDVRVGMESVNYENVVPIDPDTIVGFRPLLARNGQSNRGETPMEAFANRVANEARRIGVKHRMVCFMAAVGGTAYSNLKKGTQIYSNMLTILERIKVLEEGSGRRVVVDGIINMHILGGNGYADLLEWQGDIDDDVKAITGQEAPVRFFMGLRSSATEGQKYNMQHCVDAAINFPDKFRIASLAYPSREFYATDLQHYLGPGYALMGDYMGLAYADTMWQGQQSPTLMITGATRSGINVTLTYSVPVAPLTIDTVTIPERDVGGFVYRDSNGVVAILSAVVTDAGQSGTGTIRLTLSATPSGSAEQVEYAITPQTSPRTETGDQRGNVRDSRDTTGALDGRSLYNWAPHQVVPVTI